MSTKKLYTLILNSGFNQEFYDCTFRNGRTGPVGQRTKDRMEQAYGPALKWEEWTPPVAEAPARKSRGKVAPRVTVKARSEAIKSKRYVEREDGKDDADGD
jgi:hypothetical protein